MTTLSTKNKRQYVPPVGKLVKLRTWNDYATRNISMWSWLRVESDPLFDTMRLLEVRVMNGNQETEQTLFVPLAAINPPIGWKAQYDIYVDPEKAEMVLGWFKRGIKVKVDHDALDRMAGNCYTPADVDTAPSWGYCEADTVSPEECPKVFRIIAYKHEEFRMPKDPWSRKQYRKAAKNSGWTIESRNYGAYGYAWFRSKEVVVYDPADGLHTPAPDYMFKAPETALDLLSRLDAEYRPYALEQEQEEIRAGLPIPRWILNRAEYHLNGSIKSAGNSTWMFDPESKGDPVKRS